MSGQTFFISCVPPKSTSQGKRAVVIPGRGVRFFKAKQHQEDEDFLTALLAPHAPKTPHPKPLRVTLEIHWPYRASEPKKNTANGPIKHTSKPDCSNVVKMIEDRLVALRFIEDDAGVSDLVVQKRWSGTPGIRITIEPLSLFDSQVVIGDNNAA